MIDRSTFRSSEEALADRKKKAHDIAMYFDANGYGAPDIAKEMRCPLSTLSRAFSQGYSLEDFVFGWFLEKPRRSVPRGLRHRVNAAAVSGF